MAEAGGRIAFTEEGFNQRIQHGAAVSTSLNRVATTLSDESQSISTALQGSWGGAQQSALTNIRAALDKVNGIVQMRNSFLESYKATTYSSDAEAGSVTGADARAASDTVSAMNPRMGR